MNFETWEPAYEAILADFGFDRAADEHARDVAATLATPFPADRLSGLTDATVAIAGAGPSLTDDESLERAANADAVVAASTAVDVLVAADIAVDVMITDLDKNPETAMRLTEAGTPVAAHTHGDNVPAIREWFPRFDAEHVLATTQAAPRGPVVNLGGFTDGDRAAFLADHAGAATLRFVGWDFADPTVTEMKARKLEWAARLLHWLERRRGERFEILNGRRSTLSIPWTTE